MVRIGIFELASGDSGAGGKQETLGAQFGLFETPEIVTDIMASTSYAVGVKDWRSDKYLRRLEAMLLVADAETILIISGTGDVIEPDDGVAAIGSGGPYALAAARALRRHTELPAGEIVRDAMAIAAEICVYTNDHIIFETVTRNT